jgi:hypothetical protein
MFSSWICFFSVPWRPANLWHWCRSTILVDKPDEVIGINEMVRDAGFELATDAAKSRPPEYRCNEMCNNGL